MSTTAKTPAWSHSSLSAFHTCARQYVEVNVLKHYAQPENEAALWGDYCHKELESFLTDYYSHGTQRGLPANMSQYMGYAVQFLGRRGKTFAERKYALNRKLQPCDFHAEDVWCRGIIDVLTMNADVADVDDHKFGKNRKKDMQQLIVFALLVLYHHAHINRVNTCFHWVQHGFGEDAKDRHTFYRHEIPAMWETLLPRLTAFRDAFESGIFPPKKSGLCRKHCLVSSCEYFGG